jgi:hypothetical protein
VDHPSLVNSGTIPAIEAITRMPSRRGGGHIRWISAVLIPMGMITAGSAMTPSNLRASSKNATSGMPSLDSATRVLRNSPSSKDACEQEIEDIDKALREGRSRAELVRHARLAAAVYRDLLRDRRNSSDTLECGTSLARVCREMGLEALTAPNLRGYLAARELLGIYLEFFSEESEAAVVEYWLGLAHTQYAASGHADQLDAKTAWNEALQKLAAAAQRRNSYSVECSGQKLPLSQAAARAYALAISKLSDPFEPPNSSQSKAVAAIDSYMDTWKDVGDWGHLRFRRTILAIAAGREPDVLDKLLAMIADRRTGLEPRSVATAVFLNRWSESGRLNQKLWAERLAKFDLRSLGSRVKACMRAAGSTVSMRCVEDGKWSWANLDQFALRSWSCVVPTRIK